MNIVIAGAGEVGSNLAVRLRQEGHNIALIERDPKACKKVENLDVLMITGSASDPERLQEAGIEDADYFVAVTGSDEVNLISCTYAKFREHSRVLNVKTNGREELKTISEIKVNRNIKTLARIGNVDLIGKSMESNKFRRLGVDMAFCPDHMAARYISNILLTPSLFTMKIFTETAIMVLEASIKDSTPVVGMRYRDISDIFDYANIVLLYRKSEVIIPRKDMQFLPGDRLLILLLNPERLSILEEYFGRGLQQVRNEQMMKRIIILGATRVGIKLATILKQDKDQKRHITLIDKNPADVDIANRVFAKHGLNVNVIMGNGTNVDLLKDNRIEKADAFVTVTLKEQTNIISSLLAKKLGANRTVTIIENEELQHLFEGMSIDTIVNTKLSAVSTIFPYILSKNIESMSIIEGNARVVELRIPWKSKFSGKFLSKLSLPSGVKVGALMRGKKPYIPSKNFELKSGDKLILFGKGNFITKLSELF